MKIETSQVTRLRLTELDGLDSVTVMLENFEPGKGKIHIECYGESWSSFWPGMSGDSVEVFFCRCNESYLAGNLAPLLNSSVPDLDGLVNVVRKEVITQRRSKELDESDARELWDEAENLVNANSIKELQHYDILPKMLGREWWYSIPETVNPKYDYLCRIIRAVQAGLTQYLEEQENNMETTQ